MDVLVLKLKTKSGSFIIRELNKYDTVAAMKILLSQKCQIPPDDLHVLSGFPPKPLNLSNISSTLNSIGVRTGETLIVEEKKNAALAKINEMSNLEPTEDLAQALVKPGPRKGLLMRKVVPSDNSCLFTSVGFTLSGKIDTSAVPFMRQIIADHVAQDRETYSEAILGNTTEEYCRWITKPDSWGGAIELSILSKYYGIEMDVVDTVNAIINRFGEDKNYSQRVFLIFDGIHYDPLYLEMTEGGDIQTIFPITDESVLRDAYSLALQANISRQFTDVNRFQLRCIICQKILTGQIEAAEHARITGHTNFGEIREE